MFSTNKFSIFAWYWSCVSEPNDEQDTLKASWVFFAIDINLYFRRKKFTSRCWMGIIRAVYSVKINEWNIVYP